MDSLTEQPMWLLVGAAIVVIAVAQSFISTPGGQQESLDKGTSSTTSSSASTSTGAAASKKKKKKKKKTTGGSTAATNSKGPELEPPSEENAAAVAEEPIVEPTTASSASSAAAGKKKKKKKKKTSVSAPPNSEPVTETQEDEPAEIEDEDDDDDDVARLLSANQLSKTQKKKKKKKKKKAAGSSEDGEAEKDEGTWVMVNKQHKQEESANANAGSDQPSSDAKHTVTLALESSDKPILVGPKGATIQNITTASGARLDIDLPVLKITGTESEISAAMEMVQNLLSAHKAKSAFSTTLSGNEINSSEGIKGIIGKGGSKIKQIQSTTGCKLDADIDGGKVVITGPSEEQVQQAATLCRHAVFGEHQVTMDLQDKAKVMVVLGQNFQKIRQFQDESGGAKLDIAKNTTLLKISGPTAAVNKARDMVAAWLNHCAGITLNIPQSSPGSFDKVGAIYGKGGTTIRTIQDKTGAFIHVDDKQGKVQISGIPTAVQGALKMVQQAMEDGCLIEEGEIRDSVSIPKRAGPSVIGRSGANIKLLETNHKVKVRMSGQVCVIIGQSEAVARCKTELAQTVEPFLEEERIQQEADRLAAEQEGATAGAGAWNASIHDDIADGW